MTFYNLISCSGFEVVDKLKISIGGPCSGARLALVGLFFLNALVRKWGGEEIGVDYNFWMGLAGALIGFILVISFTGKTGLASIAGIVLMLIGGYLGGSIFSGGGDDYGYN